MQNTHKYLKLLWPFNSVLLPISIFFHALWGTLFWYHFILYEDGKINKDGFVEDSIWYAQQVGRLDLISLILAIFGIILAIIAVGWFNYIRTEAKHEAREEIRECGEKIINEYLAENPDVIIKAIQEGKIIQDTFKGLKNEMTAEIADSIANSMVVLQGNGKKNG